MVTAVVVVSVGSIPFLGLIVPNLVSMAVGDNARRAIPWIVLMGAGFVLTCDIIGRIIRFPYEIPIGTVFGVIGSALFLYLLLGRRPANG
jgi:iron complex transport system permease protein